jgi:hypothetical protein
MALNELEQAFVTLFTPTLDKVWWTCKLRESCQAPDKLALVGDGLQMTLFNVHGTCVEVFSASEHYFPEFSHGTLEQPAIIPLIEFITVLNTMAASNTRGAVQSRHKEKLREMGYRV